MERPDSLLVVARKRKGKQQTEIAAELDVTQPTVSHWETGAATPHPSMWPRIAEAYGVSLARLFSYFGEAKAS